MDHKCYDNGINLLNTEEETDVTYIHDINANIDISINDGENFIQKYYVPILLSKINEDVSSGSEFDSSK